MILLRLITSVSIIRTIIDIIIIIIVIIVIIIAIIIIIIIIIIIKYPIRQHATPPARAKSSVLPRTQVIML